MKKIYILNLFIFLSCILNAQEKQLTLSQCREMALENNKRIAIANRNKDKSAVTMKAYRTNFLPKFSAYGLGYYGGSTSNMNMKIGDITLFDPNDLAGKVPSELLPILNQFSVISIPDLNFKLKMNNTYVAGVDVEQPIYMGGKITAAYKMSKIGNDIAELNQQLTESGVIIETDKAYWTHVQAIELQKSAIKFKETVEEFHRVVKNAVEAGMKSKNDLMKVQVQVNQAELQLRRAENGVRLSRMNLCQLLGLPLLSDISLEPSFNEQLINIDPDNGIFSRPEYAMLSKQIDLKAQEKRLVQSDFLPTVGIKGSYSYINGIKLNNEKLFDNGSFSAMISVNIPLFRWGEGAKKVRAAELDKKIMQLQRDEMSEKMELELQQTINAYNEALLEVELTKTSFVQTEENEKMSRDHYEAGLETISDYLEAQTIRQNAEAEHIVAKAKLEISKSEYRKAKGELNIEL